MRVKARWIELLHPPLVTRFEYQKSILHLFTFIQFISLLWENCKCFFILHIHPISWVQVYQENKQRNTNREANKHSISQ